MDELSEQVRYMSKYGIETLDDLYADRDRLQGEMDKLTSKITELRKQLKLNKSIEERSRKIQEKPACSMPMNTRLKNLNRIKITSRCRFKIRCRTG